MNPGGSTLAISLVAFVFRLSATAPGVLSGRLLRVIACHYHTRYGQFLQEKYPRRECASMGSEIQELKPGGFEGCKNNLHNPRIRRSPASLTLAGDLPATLVDLRESDTPPLCPFMDSLYKVSHCLHLLGAYEMNFFTSLILLNFFPYCKNVALTLIVATLPYFCYSTEVRAISSFG